MPDQQNLQSQSPESPKVELSSESSTLNPPPSPPPQSKAPWKILILIISIAAIISLSATAWLLYNPSNQKTIKPPDQSLTTSPTPIANPTASPIPDGIGANWQTYTNQEFNFSLKHPLSEKSNCITDGENKLCAYNQELVQLYDPENMFLKFININFQELDNNQTFDKYIDEVEQGLLQEITKYSQAINSDLTSRTAKSQLKIGGQPAYLLKGYFIEEGPWLRYYIKHPDKKSVILLTGIYDDQSQLDQILSTFRFLDE